MQQKQSWYVPVRLGFTRHIEQKTLKCTSCVAIATLISRWLTNVPTQRMKNICAQIKHGNVCGQRLTTSRWRVLDVQLKAFWTRILSAGAEYVYMQPSLVHWRIPCRNRLVCINKKKSITCGFVGIAISNEVRSLASSNIHGAIPNFWPDNQEAKSDAQNLGQKWL